MHLRQVDGQYVLLVTGPTNAQRYKFQVPALDLDEGTGHVS